MKLRRGGFLLIDAMVGLAVFAGCFSALTAGLRLSAAAFRQAHEHKLALRQMVNVIERLTAGEQLMPPMRFESDAIDYIVDWRIAPTSDSWSRLELSVQWQTRQRRRQLIVTHEYEPPRPE